MHWLATFFIIASCSVQAIQPVPELIDLRLVGTSESAYFHPREVTLKVGQLYLFVLENQMDLPYGFVAETFSSAIQTQSIQSSPSVTRGSIQIPAHSKIQWILTPKVAGTHLYSAQSNGFQRSLSESGTITILSEEDVGLQKPDKATLQAKAESQVATIRQDYSIESAAPKIPQNRKQKLMTRGKPN